MPYTLNRIIYRFDTYAQSLRGFLIAQTLEAQLHDLLFKIAERRKNSGLRFPLQHQSLRILINRQGGSLPRFGRIKLCMTV